MVMPTDLLQRAAATLVRAIAGPSAMASHRSVDQGARALRREVSRPAARTVLPELPWVQQNAGAAHDNKAQQRCTPRSRWQSHCRQSSVGLAHASLLACQQRASAAPETRRRRSQPLHQRRCSEGSLLCVTNFLLSRRAAGARCGHMQCNVKTLARAVLPFVPYHSHRGGRALAAPSCRGKGGWLLRAHRRPVVSGDGT